MNIAIAGASGFIGHALLPALRQRGHKVFRLVRGRAQSADERSWFPAERRMETAALADIDAVINLAGASVASGRWTPARRELIRRSRLDATATLVGAMSASDRPRILLNASAVGIYGDRGDELLTEQSATGAGFLADVTAAWEAGATGAAAAGIRTVLLRFGVVLAEEGGALRKMLPLFRAGLGGRLGSGRQWMSWISRRDAVAAIAYLLDSPAATGPFNLVAPEPVTNAAFTAALARALHRPAVLPAPAFALRVAFGQMADEALLASARVLPERLRTSGFAFAHPNLATALPALLEVNA